MSTKITLRQSELPAIPGGWVRRALVHANDICKSGWLALYTRVSGSRKKIGGRFRESPTLACLWVEKDPKMVGIGYFFEYFFKSTIVSVD